ncbi:MAG: hypothetical protein WC538_12450 [Thermoanaerobaculia bacterium]|jgi:hypothetical protein
MIVAFLLALATSPFTFSPAKPTIGDAITIKASGASFEVRPSQEFEVVSTSPGEVVLRTFHPGTLRVEVVTHTPGEVTETGTLAIEVASVLAAGDEKLEPAPLRPPKELPRENTAWIAIGIAAGAAALLWALLALLLRFRRMPAIPEIPQVEDPAEAFRAALAKLRTLGDDESKWVLLSSATRRYLASTEPSLGVELTSYELLATMRRAGRRADTVATVESILRGGDWTKFSPFGAPRVSIDTLVGAAAELIPAAPEGEAAA